MIIDCSSGKCVISKPGSEFDTLVFSFLNEWNAPSETVNVKTSGSTGIPKIFPIEKVRMVTSAQMTCQFLALKPNNVALLCLPVDYISGKMMVVRAIVAGLKLMVQEPTIKPLQHLSYPVDFCAMTPLQVENSLDKIHLIKKLIIGGAAVSDNLKNKIFKFLGESNNTMIFETYGMSETLSHIALKQIYPLSEVYFTTLDGVEISLDERGCLVIDAPELNPQILKTNDLVELKNESRFRFIGRVDNVINSGGAKIFPEELEALAKSIIEREIVFASIKDETFGEKLVTVIEGEKSKWIKEKILGLPYQKSFHKPKDVIFISQLPRTPNGKIDRLKLQEIINDTDLENK